MSSVILLISSAVYFQSSLLILNYINDHVEKPYMDEIFHVPQAQQYCLGNYNEWNDKLTTLPGLYLLSTSLLRLIALAIKIDQANILNLVCNAYYLRLFNVFLSTLVFIIVYKIFIIINSKKLINTNYALFTSILTAFSICLFPLNYFFQFLYYTDIGSTLFVLLAYHQQLKKNYNTSGICGALAILFRQTNIVWVLFCVFQILLLNAETLVKNEESKQLAKQSKDINAIYQQRNKKHSNTFELISRTPNQAFGKDFDLIKFINKFYREDIWGKKIIYGDVAKILDFEQLRTYIMVILTFLFFVYTNNGIVVGDRSNHQASFHICQLFYFWSFSCFFSSSSFLLSYKKIKNLISFLSSNFKIIIIFVLPLFCLIIQNFTYEHSFLLADNRHYTFYIWSRIFKKHEVVKFLLSPIYLICMYLFYRNIIVTGKSLGWLIAFTVCVFVCLVPQKLIEFRYFIIPYLIYRLNINELAIKEILVELLLNLSLNVLTIYIFVNKTFSWPDSSEVQRFMW